jgi:hypothetical protein
LEDYGWIGSRGVFITDPGGNAVKLVTTVGGAGMAARPA